MTASLQQRRYDAADGTVLCYRQIGPTSGTPLVLCHGLAASSRQFEADAAHFATLGHRVLLPDLRGGRDTAVNLALQPSLDRLMPRQNWRVVDLPQGGHCANLDATADWRAALTAFWADPLFSAPA